jgi:hypothetical protein
MAYLSPVGNSPIVDSNGAPLSGGSIYTYLAGTSTPAATYTTSAGDVQQANPVPLNANGMPSSPIWLAPGVAMKLVIADADDVPLSPTFDDILGVNDPSDATAQDQWVQFSGTPTYINATSFSVSGDQTPTLEVGRRVKSSNSGGTIYSTISASSYAANVTTVTVVNSSGTLDSGLSSVSYGLLSVTNSSVSANALLNIETAKSLTGTSVDFTGIQSWVKRITITLVAASTNGTSPPIVQIGDSGGIEATSYVGTVWNSGSAAGTALSTGFNILQLTAAATTFGGTITLVRHDALNTWVADGRAHLSSTNVHSVSGYKALSATLDRIRITMVNGTDTFDAGTVNIVYE